MRFLVISTNRERTPWPVPPVGACAIATSAEQAGQEVRFLDLCFSRDPQADVRHAVRSFRPDAVGLSIRNIDNCDSVSPRFYPTDIRREVFDTLREEGEFPLIIGGPAVGISPGELLEFFGADYAVIGDGEVAVPLLLEALRGGGHLRDVPGLVRRESGKVVISEPARVENLDSLPLPEPHRWLDLRRYAKFHGAMGIQTKRGCALKCTYCSYNRIEGRCYRLKSPERVVREVEQALVQGGMRSVEFVDSTFNIPMDHAMNVCRALVERKFDANFLTMGINPGAVSEEFFRMLGEAGFSEVSMTPETASPRMLKALGKGFDRAAIDRAAAVARRTRLPVMWYFMFGAPGETEETVRETLDFIDREIPETHLVLLVSGIRIVPGAPLEQQARAEGQLAEGQSLLRPVFYEPPIGRQRLAEIIEQQMRRRPNCISMQDEYMPDALLATVSAVHRFFHSKKPLWQYLRHLRRLINTFGISSHALSQGKLSKGAA